MMGLSRILRKFSSAPHRIIVYIGMTLFVCLSVALLVVQRDKSSGFYSPTGYIDKVNTLINKKKLVFKNNKIEKRQLDELEEEFLGKSYLADDIKQFNNGRRDFFVIEGGKLKQIDLYTHRFPLPSQQDPRSWKGRLFFRATYPNAVLFNKTQTIKVVQAKCPWAVEYKQVALNRPRTQETFHVAKGITLVYFAGESRFAEVTFPEDRKKMVIKPTDKNIEIYVNGEKISFHNKAELNDGDVIAIKREKHSTVHFFFTQVAESTVLSLLKSVNGRPTRTSLDRGMDFGKEIAGTLDFMVKQDKDKKVITREDFDVYLTVDEVLNRQINRLLESFVDRRWSRPQDKLFKACVTVMDIKSGDILALASYPSLKILNELKNEIEIPDGVMNRLNKNHNLSRHVIGSVAKVFLSSAIFNANPELLSFRINCHPPFDSETMPDQDQSFMGVTLRKGIRKVELLRDSGLTCNDNPEAFEIGVNEFIKYSCNKYIVDLGLLSLAIDPVNGLQCSPRNLSADQYFQLNNRIIKNQPNLDMYLTSDMVVLNFAYWQACQQLKDLFEIEVELTGKDTSIEDDSQNLDWSIWNPLIKDYFKIDDPDVLRSFGYRSGEKVNLAINTFRDLRKDFIPILVGGGNNWWNNIKLCEAMSRLILRKKIKAKIISKIEPDNSKYIEPEELSLLKPNVRQGMLHALEQVAKEGGTAAEIEQVLNKYNQGQEKYKIYSKTGTGKRTDKSPNSAIYLFTLVKQTGEGEPQNGLTAAIYIEDKGKSKIAVDFAQQLLPYLFEYMSIKDGNKNTTDI